jgi:hypothetical protein
MNNEAHDQLEVELAALRPHDASPELRQRIDDHRAHSMPPSWRWQWSLALAGGLAAACLMVVLFQWGDSRRVSRVQTSVRVQPALPDSVQDSGLTRLAYGRALARSPEDLDALLDKDAMAAQRPNAELVRICAFPRSDAALHALLGEN